MAVSASYADIFSSEEKHSIEILRSKVKDVHTHEDWKTDAALFRFLSARGMDVEKAAAQYTAAMKWREENDVDTILEWYKEPEVLRKYFPTGFHGEDREGYPVLVELIGNIDLVGMEAAVGETEFLRWVTWYHERQEKFMRDATIRKGELRDKFTCIIDLNNLSSRLLTASTYAVIKKRIRMEEDNYPEVVKRVFIIRAPAVFTAVWKICGAFLDKGTRDKIKILGSDYLKVLDKHVDISKLPKFLGGNEENHSICMGGTVPLKYIAGYNEQGVEVELSKGKGDEVILDLGSGQEVKWAYHVADGKDVEFTAHFIPASKCSGTVTPLGSVESRDRESVPQMSSNDDFVPYMDTKRPISSFTPLPDGCPLLHGPERNKQDSGSYTVSEEEGGQLVLRWSNRYSWMKSKLYARRILISKFVSTD